MAIITYPLNGILYDAEDAETYLCTRTSGVFSSDGHFPASVTGQREVTIGPGLAWIQNEEFHGKSVYNEDNVALTIAEADAYQTRIDRIVLQFDKLLNRTELMVKQGTPANSPKAPDIQRDSYIYELGLYTVTVKNSSISVSASDVANTFLDEKVCGIMEDAVTSIPTQELYDQWYSWYEGIVADTDAFEKQLDIWFEALKESAEADIANLEDELNKWKDEQEEEFDEWFENLKYVLDGDVAGHLQVEIENVEDMADTALEQLATGWVRGYMADDDDCNEILLFGTDDDQYGVILPRKICACVDTANSTHDTGATVTQSQVDDALEKYLETHTLDSTPVDDTLTKSGEAADAKVVGEKFSELENNIGSGTGSTVSVNVGTTTTGEAGSDADVSNSGDDQNVVLNFTIPRGADGEQGAKGDTGPQGEKGDTGPQGEQGTQGEQGPEGPQGETGPAGEDGFSPTVDISKSGKVTTITITDKNGEHSAEIIDGQDGTSGEGGGTGTDGYSPTVSVSKSDGVTTIIITDVNGEHTATINDGEQGPQGETGPQGEKGDTGPQGEKGDTGAAATIKVGTVTTGDAGTSASVTNSGTENAAVFDFVIPKGEQGGVSFGQRFTSLEALYEYGVSELSTYQMDFFAMSNASELTGGDTTNSCKGMICRQNTSIVDFLIYTGTGTCVYTGRISSGNLANWYKYSPDSAWEEKIDSLTQELDELKEKVGAITNVTFTDPMTSLIGF